MYCIDNKEMKQRPSLNFSILEYNLIYDES